MEHEVRQAVKLPIPVHYIQLTKDSLFEVHTFLYGKPPFDKRAPDITHNKWWDYCNTITQHGYLELKTQESGDGYQKASLGDYILKGIDGEYWPVKPDIFERTYQTVSPSSTAPQPSTLSISEVIDAYVDRIEYNHSIQRDVFRIKYDAFESWFKQQGFTIQKKQP